MTSANLKSLKSAPFDKNRMTKTLCASSQPGGGLSKLSLSSEAPPPHAPNPKAQQDEKGCFRCRRKQRCGTIWGLGFGPKFLKYGLPPLPIPVGQLMPTPLSLTEHQMGAATIFCLFSVWRCVRCMPKFLHCQHSF